MIVLASAAALVGPMPTATAADSRGLTVSVLTDMNDSNLQISVTNGAAIGPGDVVFEYMEVLGQDLARVYIDADSAASRMLTAGEGCKDEKEGLSVLCTLTRGRPENVSVDLAKSEYSGGDLVFVNDSYIPMSFAGSEFADYVQGGTGADSIDGRGGADSLFGGDGNDWILGGEGPDKIYGEDGNDTIFGDLGADYIDVEGGPASEADVVNCNNFLPAVQNTDNDPARPPNNVVDFDKGVDRITDCGLPGAPTVLTVPSLTGVPRVGVAATASPGAWTGKALRMSYTWFACPAVDDTVPEVDEAPAGACTEVFARDGDKGLSYTPTAADLGTYLRLRATARNNAGFAVAVSPASAKTVIPSATPGVVRNLAAKVSSVKLPSGKRAYTLLTTWSPPEDEGRGIKEYVVEFVGLTSTTETQVTSKLQYDLVLTRYTRGDTVMIRVAARGPKGASEQGPWSARVSVTLPRR